jgi:hypothetical protein
MIQTLPTTTAALLAILATGALFQPTLSAQQVLISEVRAEGGERWVELHNTSPGVVNLSSWSLYYASHTVGMPQSYWWPFPAGTALQPGAFLRVHWFQAAPPGAAAPGELWTGTSFWGFLFGYGGEALLPARGAIGLLRSQLNTQMNSPSIVEDWVGWGESGYAREWLAIQAGLWTTNTATPPIPAGQSLARDTTLVGMVGNQAMAWFLDPSPTPLAPNTTGAVLTEYGAPCSLPGNHLLAPPQLRGTSQPVLGNAAFALATDWTTGLFAEFVLVAFSAGAAPGGQPSILPPYAGIGCDELIDTSQLVTTWLVPAQLMTTTMPLPLSGLPTAAVGTELHAQALVLDLLAGAYPPYQGVTNALRIVLGQ